MKPRLFLNICAKLLVNPRHKMRTFTQCDDHISLSGLGLTAHVGVPVEERNQAQRLSADIILWPVGGLSDLQESLSRTIDYDAAARLCRTISVARPRHLIETLAEDLCDALLSTYALEQVRVKLEKFILPDTKSVAVTLTRFAKNSSPTQK